MFLGEWQLLHWFGPTIWVAISCYIHDLKSHRTWVVLNCWSRIYSSSLAPSGLSKPSIIYLILSFSKSSSGLSLGLLGFNSLGQQPRFRSPFAGQKKKTLLWRQLVELPLELFYRSISWRHRWHTPPIIKEIIPIISPAARFRFVKDHDLPQLFYFLVGVVELILEHAPLSLIEVIHLFLSLQVESTPITFASGNPGCSFFLIICL